MDEKQVKFLDIDEAANLLHFRKSYLYRLVHEKRIPYYKPRGGRILFDRVELEAFIRAGRVASNGENVVRADSILNRVGTLAVYSDKFCRAIRK